MENYENSPQGMQQDAMEQAGRATDDAMGHLTTGEIVIPLPMLEDPQVMEMLNALFADAQMNIAEFTVGDPANKINPETGYPEFFSFKKIFKAVKNIALPAALAYFAPGIGTALGSGLGITSAAGTAALGGAAAGGLSGLSSGGGIGGALKGAALGGAGGYVAGGGINDTMVGRGANQLSNNVGAGNIFGGGTGTDFAGTSVGRGINSISNKAGLGDVLGSNAPSIDKIVSAPIGAANSSTAATGAAGASAGGGSSFGLGTALANIAGGLAQDSAIKKQQKQLLGANAEQLANLETFNPADITSQPNYEFQRAQGQEGLNRQLAASGALGSGRAIKAAAEYNQNYAGNAFQQAYANWLQKTQLKNQAVGNAGEVRAQTTGAGSQNIAQSLSNAIGGKVGQYGGGGLTPEQLAMLLGNKQAIGN